MKLSIIVPIYNVEEYIARCALSLVNQTASFDDYEVVFVNDGTKDNSIEVLQNTLDFEHSKNIHIVDKPNGGLSSARNYGIEHSKGEYLWFVDSDDWIDNDSVEVLLSFIKHCPDVVVTTQMYSNIGPQQSFKYSHAINFEGSGSDLIKHYPPVCSVAYICARSFLEKHELRFREGILHEDAELIPRLIYLAEKTIATDRALYHHFQRENSITHVINPHRYDSYFIVLDTLSSFYSSSVKDEEKKYFARLCASHILGLLSISRKAEKSTKKKVNDYFAKNRILSSIMMKSPDILAKLIGVSIALSPSGAVGIADFYWKLRGK